MSGGGHGGHGAGHGGHDDHGGHGHAYDPVAKAGENYQKITPILAGAQLHHTESYLHAAKKVLSKDKGKTIHYDWLAQGDGHQSAKEVREAFVKEMTEFYKAKVIEQHPTAKDDVFLDGFLQTIYGYNEAQIKSAVHRTKAGFTVDFYGQNVVPQLTRYMTQQRQAKSTEHVSVEDITTITEKLGVKDRLKAGLDVDEAKALLHRYHEKEGHLDDSDLEQIVGEKVEARESKTRKKAGHGDDHGAHH
ncbi:hypothetical protein HYV86_02885 [Candidatus Woesearchaeota archaeon]|nr:hypothetical protein [Candidatus Woesearchaeota archaeon]